MATRSTLRAATATERHGSPVALKRTMKVALVAVALSLVSASPAAASVLLGFLATKSVGARTSDLDWYRSWDGGPRSLTVKVYRRTHRIRSRRIKASTHWHTYRLVTFPRVGSYKIRIFGGGWGGYTYRLRVAQCE